jgi:DNA-binding NtrC family response regulator
LGWLISEEATAALGRAVSVIMFGGNGSEAEAAIAQRFGANAHLTKPASLQEFDKAVERICSFWLLTVEH